MHTLPHFCCQMSLLLDALPILLFIPTKVTPRLDEQLYFPLLTSSLSTEPLLFLIPCIDYSTQVLCLVSNLITFFPLP